MKPDFLNEAFSTFQRKYLFYVIPPRSALRERGGFFFFSHAKECARRPNIQTGALAETPQ